MIASNETFVIAAYAVTWAVLVAYVWRLARMYRKARGAHSRVSEASAR